MSSYDVIVVGAGNAGLAAAVSAKQSGAAQVLVLEKAPSEMSGGDTAWAGGGGLRFAFEEPEELRDVFAEAKRAPSSAYEAIKPYTRAQFRADMMLVANGRADPELVDLVVEASRETVKWMCAVGVDLDLIAPRTGSGGNAMTGGSIVQARRGGGGLSREWFSVAAANGIEVRYGAAATALSLGQSGRIAGVTVRGPDGIETLFASSVVLAAGGFGANPQMRAQHLGPLTAGAMVRGTPHNQGDGLRMAMAIGAMPAGQWNGAHMSPVAADWGNYTPRNASSHSVRASYVYSLMLNRAGHRFIDEGEDKSLMTYPTVARAILAQPGAIAWQIYDSQVLHLLGESYRAPEPTIADTLEELVERIAIGDKATALRTIAEYNRHAQSADTGFDPARKDGLATSGLKLPKSNWAIRLDRPPFHAYSVACGITWTYGGLKVNRDAQVIGTDWRPIPGLFCCGEMVGDLFYDNYPTGIGYPAGAGFMSGAVFGRTAGRNAAAGRL